jgi:hypothetical protein
MAAKKLRPVIVTTAKNYVTFGYIETTAHKPGTPFPKALAIRGAKCAIYWGTTKGLGELASVGPNSKSKIGSPMDITLTEITLIGDVTPDAVKAWERA